MMMYAVNKQRKYFGDNEHDCGIIGNVCIFCSMERGSLYVT